MLIAWRNSERRLTIQNRTIAVEKGLIFLANFFLGGGGYSSHVSSGCVD